MTTYLVTGVTGFIGRHLAERLLGLDDIELYAVVRQRSQERLAALTRGWPHGDRVIPIAGDLARPLLGIDPADIERLTDQVDHMIHLAALYDMTAPEEANQAANVGGTRHAVELANRLGVRCFHHVSSVAVAGDHRGVFREEDFDIGQRLPSPYHATKFEAERLVRDEARVPWRVYRPAVVIGSSLTGEMDKIDGPYYFFEGIQRLAGLPSWLPIAGPDLGQTNVVPVDYVAAATAHLIGRPGLDGRTFHLVAPRPQPLADVYNAFARAAGAPRIAATVPRRVTAPLGGALRAATRSPAVEFGRDLVLDQLGIPPQVLPHVTFPAVFDDTRTRRELATTTIRVPDLNQYAPVLWRYWRDHLDPRRARRVGPGGPLAGRRIVITGASSGIGRATAERVAQDGAVPILVARRTDALEEVRSAIEERGGEAFVYACDLTQPESVDQLIKQLLADHDSIDMLVNNAGRSIRRSVRLSFDRFHDYERTMALNYFGAVRLILGLLPHMSERRFGHIVNVSSIGVQANPPRFSAYVASKAALDAFSRVVASETLADGVTFTTVHMPLVRTPMIRPTTIYNAFPTISPDEAAALVVRGLKERPKELGTRLGTLAEVCYAVAPKAVDAVLHVAYRAFPDSRAAMGSEEGPEQSAGEALSESARAVMKLLPGVHW
jgi:NAD(P)-dependent dehydrogenase (short-subunit alcohol dehydrogenase family)